MTGGVKEGGVQPRDVCQSPQVEVRVPPVLVRLLLRARTPGEAGLEVVFHDDGDVLSEGDVDIGEEGGVPDHAQHSLRAPQELLHPRASFTLLTLVMMVKVLLAPVTESPPAPPEELLQVVAVHVEGDRGGQRHRHHVRHRQHRCCCCCCHCSCCCGWCCCPQ